MVQYICYCVFYFSFDDLIFETQTNKILKHIILPKILKHSSQIILNVKICKSKILLDWQNLEKTHFAWQPVQQLNLAEFLAFWVATLHHSN